MRPGITAKLFLAIFSTCVLVLATMHWGVRLSFEHGFIDYIRQAMNSASRCWPTLCGSSTSSTATGSFCEKTIA